QGSCVGGSTVLSNGVLLRPDEAVFRSWASLGAVLDRQELEASYDKVETALGAVTPGMGNVSKSTKLFIEGARNIGREPRCRKKALGDCVGCGFCNIGCVYDFKQSAVTTYSPWAEQKGARILAETTVQRIRCRGGRAGTIEAVTGPSAEPLVIDAKIVVVAAG